MLIINLLRPLLAYANAEVYMNSLFLFATSVFVFTILYFMRRIRLFTLLMNPVSNMMKLIK